MAQVETRRSSTKRTLCAPLVGSLSFLLLQCMCLLTFPHFNCHGQQLLSHRKEYFSRSSSGIGSTNCLSVDTPVPTPKGELLKNTARQTKTTTTTPTTFATTAASHNEWKELFQQDADEEKRDSNDALSPGTSFVVVVLQAQSFTFTTAINQNGGWKFVFIHTVLSRSTRGF
jgi:hypothetical protein